MTGTVGMSAFDVGQETLSATESKGSLMLPIISSHDLCRSCNGACCRGVSTLPSDDPGWLANLPRNLRVEIVAKQESDPEGVKPPCLWLTKEGKCRHYEYRPFICRAFGPASVECFELRDLEGVVGDGNEMPTNYTFAKPPLLVDLIADVGQRKYVNDVLWAVTNELEGIYLNSETDAECSAKLNQLIDRLSSEVKIP